MQGIEDAVLNVCDQRQQNYCNFAGIPCDTCNKKKAKDIHPYVAHLLKIRNMREIGYPINAEDLPIEQWLDLITLESAISKARRKKKK